MKEKTSIEKAYGLAVSYGYDGRLYAPISNTEWLDPLFWQALGKSLGWTAHCDKAFLEGFAHKPSTCEGCKKAAWVNRWHQFIDHLASGGTPDDFFTNLLPPRTS